MGLIIMVDRLALSNVHMISKGDGKGLLELYYGLPMVKQL